MAKAGRRILAVLLGTVVWGILWNVGTRVAMASFPDLLQPEQPVTHTGILLGYLGYSVLLSVLAGFLTAIVAGGANPMTAVWILAVLQLGIGIAVEVSYWSLMPAWYHLIFLALVVPATVWGGMLRAGNHGARAEPTS